MIIISESSEPSALIVDRIPFVYFEDESNELWFKMCLLLEMKNDYSDFVVVNVLLQFTINLYANNNKLKSNTI